MLETASGATIMGKCQPGTGNSLHPPEMLADPGSSEKEITCKCTEIGNIFCRHVLCFDLLAQILTSKDATEGGAREQDIFEHRPDTPDRNRIVHIFRIRPKRGTLLTINFLIRGRSENYEV